MLSYEASYENNTVTECFLDSLPLKKKIVPKHLLLELVNY